MSAYKPLVIVAGQTRQLDDNDQLFLPVGGNSTPSLTFSGDLNTGLYWVGADQVGIATGGVLRLTINGSTSITSTLVHYAPAGDASGPAFSFSGDTNTGIYSIGADQLGLSTGGTLRLTLSTTALTSTLVVVGPLALENAPTFTFASDLDTGMWSSGANIINFSTSGAERLEISSSAVVVNDIGADIDFRVEGDTNANLFVIDAGNDRIGIGAAPPSNSILTIASGLAEAYYSGRSGMLRATGVGNQFLWGHSNTEYLNTFGVTNGAGQAFIGFYCYHGLFDNGDMSTWNKIYRSSATNLPTILFVTETGTINFQTAPAGTADAAITDFNSQLSIIAGGQMQIRDGSNSIPGYSFGSDTNTGVYRVGSDQLGITTGGVLRFTVNGSTSITSTLVYYGPDGSNTAPTFSFTSDPNTGMYSTGADTIGWGTGGTLRLSLDSAGNLGLGAASFGSSAAAVLALKSGTAPSTSPTDTIQLWEADRAATAGKGSLFLRTEDGTTHVFGDRVGIGTTSPATALDVNGTVTATAFATSTFLAGDGDATNPSHSFTNDTNTGLYSVGADQLGITVGGTLRVTLSTTAVISTVAISNALGDASAPGYSFTGDLNTGMFSSTGDVLNFTTGGTERVRIDGSGNVGVGVTSFGSSSVKVLVIGTGTAPSGSVTDGVQLFSKDTNAVAGKAGLHIRSEDGVSHCFGHRVGIGTLTPADSVLTLAGNLGDAYNSGRSGMIRMTGAGNQLLWGHSNTEYLNCFAVTNGGGAAFLGFYCYHGLYDSGDMATWNKIYRASATNLPSAIFVQTDGSFVFQTAPSGTADAAITDFNTQLTITAGGQFRLRAGSNGTPGLALGGDNDTGIYSVGSDQFGITTGGTLRLTVNAAVSITSTLPFYGQNGSNSIPAYTFSGDANTGMYNVGADQLGFATNGTLRLTVDGSTSITSTLVHYGPNGTASDPTFAFTSDSNTGVYRVGADQLGLTTGGTLRLTVDGSTSITSTLPIYGPNGSNTAPTYSFTNDPNTGMYGTGSDEIRFACGGVLSVKITTGAQILASGGGTNSTPAFAINNGLNTTTGFWGSITGDLGLSSSGNVVLYSSAFQNVGLCGAITFGASAANTIAILNGTAPTGDVSGQCAVYSEGGVFKVRNSSGRILQSDFNDIENSTLSQWFNNPGATAPTTSGITISDAGTGSTTNGDTADGRFNVLTTGGTSTNARTRSSSAADVCQGRYNPRYTQRVATSATNTSIRIWHGLFSASPTGSATPAVSYAGFRYDTAADGTAFWRCVSDSGTGTPQATTTTVALSNSTAYKLQIRGSAASWEFFIDGVLVATHGTTIPVSSTSLSAWSAVTTLTGSARAHSVGRGALLVD